jgi:hypothetical protein
MMNRGILEHRLGSGLYRVLLWPLLWVMRGMLFRTDTHDSHHGIVIAHIGPEREIDPLFVPKTKEALDFLKATDARRFRRVQQFIKAIVFSHRGGASYNAVLQKCNVGFAHFHFEQDEPHKVPWYATTLVHEATHGALHAREIPYNRRTRMRCERLCTMEEWRFVQRFADDSFDWKSLVWRKWNERHWDAAREEGIVHRFKTLWYPNAHGELEDRGSTTTKSTLSSEAAPSAASDER